MDIEDGKRYKIEKIGLLKVHILMFWDTEDVIITISV